MRLQHYVSGNVFSITPHISFKYQPIYGYGTARRQLPVIRLYTASYRLILQNLVFIEALFIKLEKQIGEKIFDMCKDSNSERAIMFIFAPISEEFHSAYHTESRG